MPSAKALAAGRAVIRLSLSQKLFNTQIAALHGKATQISTMFNSATSFASGRLAALQARIGGLGLAFSRLRRFGPAGGGYSTSKPYWRAVWPRPHCSGRSSWLRTSRSRQR